ncbi:MAG: hypothetical protein ACI909_003078, partial [Planctomycetota bacterium]
YRLSRYRIKSVSAKFSEQIELGKLSQNSSEK